jgi:hypothetical protein
MTVYVNSDDLNYIARFLDCQPSEAVQRLVDNNILATRIDDVRRMSGDGPDQVFRTGKRYELSPIPDDVTIDPVE